MEPKSVNIKELKNILFLDIETVSNSASFNELNDRVRSLWSRKASFLKKDEDVTDEDLYFQRAGIYAEFGKVITIGMGYFHMEGDQLSLRVKALYNNDEKALLKQFIEIVHKAGSDDIKLCAHNGREFDFPYLSRRMLINGLTLPGVLDLYGKKPWEVNHIDTMDMWKFGDWKHYTSLDLLAAVFDIDSSKTDMHGGDVNAVYHQEGDLPKIAQYCLRDVVVTAQVYLKMKNIPADGLDIVVVDPN